MITQEDQLELFRIISNEIKTSIDCFAFGGTAMMFYGYQDETKDIDLLFNDEKSRKIFIETIEKIGFKEFSPMKIYPLEKLREKNRPLMFIRDDYRFDLFVKKIFKTKISKRMKDDLFALHEFKGEKKFTIKVVRKEHIVQLKSVTERDKDFEDILTIIKKEKNFDWKYLIDETIWQHKNGDSWAIIDVEKTLSELKKYNIFIEKKYFDQLRKSL